MKCNNKTLLENQGGDVTFVSAFKMIHIQKGMLLKAAAFV